MFSAYDAIDMNLNSWSLTVQGDVDLWFRASLDKEHCIKQVKHYYGSQSKNTHTCSKDTCTCKGQQCTSWHLRVYHEQLDPGDNVPSGCKLGDTVEIKAVGTTEIKVNELVIIAAIGSLLNSLTLIYYSKYVTEAYPTM